MSYLEAPRQHTKEDAFDVLGIAYLRWNHFVRLLELSWCCLVRNKLTDSDSEEV